MHDQLLHAGMRLDVLLEGGRAGLCALRAPRGTGLPNLMHPHADLTLTVVDGTVDVWRDADRRRLTGPAAWALPRGRFCGFRAVSEEASLLLLATPGGFEAVLARAATAAGEPALDADDVAALFAGAGVTVLG